MADIVPKGLDSNGQSNYPNVSDAYLRCTGGHVLHDLDYVQLHKSSTQVLGGSSAGITITFDVELADTADFHDNVTNNERITVPAAFDGRVVELFAEVVLTAENTSGLEAWIEHYDSGDALINNLARFFAMSANNQPAQFNVITQPLVVSNGDYFILRVANDSPNPKTIDNGTEGTTFTMIVN